MTDVKTRYGSYPQPKWDQNLALLELFQSKTGKNIYTLCHKRIKLKEQL